VPSTPAQSKFQAAQLVSGIYKNSLPTNIGIELQINYSSCSCFSSSQQNRTYIFSSPVLSRAVSLKIFLVQDVNNFDIDAEPDEIVRKVRKGSRRESTLIYVLVLLFYFGEGNADCFENLIVKSIF